jgi:hypothetical protein
MGIEVLTGVETVTGIVAITGIARRSPACGGELSDN